MLGSCVCFVCCFPVGCVAGFVVPFLLVWISFCVCVVVTFITWWVKAAGVVQKESCWGCSGWGL